MRSAIPDVVDAYQAGLLRVESVLAEQPEPWQSCRRQAVAILEDCIATLENGCLPDTTEAEEYTRLLGANRAFQRIPVAESVRAAEVLWSAVQPAVHTASASAAPQERAVIQQKVSAAFRAAASVRLYAGCQGYDETRERILASFDTRFRATQPRPAPAPAREERGDAAEELTTRERQILDAVACALTNRQIARKLDISEGTVKRHLYNIFNKLGATSRMDAVLKGAKRT
ncbi:helix-turn-helix transcriptional regulator [Streptomyces sp. NPDC019990]|uniref:helix-turn-helix transcriptional regulator n=1 Tax=Streptomyces sp. NPDC019990 TaxID=3154693 RepID=UPI0033C109E1